MNKTSGRRQLRRDTPEVSHTAKPQAYCVMLSAAMNGNAATFNSFNDAGRSTPILRDRRRVLGGIAASYAGLAGTAIVSFNPLPPSPAAAQAALHNPQAPCGEPRLWPRTKRQWSTPVPGRSEDSSETAFISSRVFPTAHLLQVQTASCRR